MRTGGTMHVLAVCDTRSSLVSTLVCIQTKTTIIYRTTADELAHIKTLDRLDAYGLIVVSAIDWRVPTTTPNLVRHFRSRFDGPIVAVGGDAEWLSSMKEAGCNHTLKSSENPTQFIHDLLFPPTPET